MPVVLIRVTQFIARYSYHEADNFIKLSEHYFFCKGGKRRKIATRNNKIRVESNECAHSDLLLYCFTTFAFILGIFVCLECLILNRSK